jgi:hypothetical protein
MARGRDSRGGMLSAQRFRLRGIWRISQSIVTALNPSSSRGRLREFAKRCCERDLHRERTRREARVGGRAR